MTIYTIQIICKYETPNPHLNRVYLHYHSFQAVDNIEAIDTTEQWIVEDLSPLGDLSIIIETLPDCLEFEEFKLIVNFDNPEESFDIARFTRGGQTGIWTEILDK